MKKICLIMLNIRTAQDYRKNLYSIFGNSVTIDILSFDDYSKEKVSDVDIFLLHNNYLLKEVDIPLELPMGVRVIACSSGFLRCETVGTMCFSWWSIRSQRRAISIPSPVN